MKRSPATAEPVDLLPYLHLTCASTIQPRPVKWLWAGRIALGALNLLGGREGIGKSTTGYDAGARITRGCLDGDCFGTPRNVIIAATEDSREHTAIPRLMAAGADLSRVFFVDVALPDGVQTGLSLPRDLVALDQQTRDVRAAAILLDPLMSRLDGALDTHKDADTRRGLEPIVTLADATGAAVVGLIHVNKSNTQDALSSLMGSRAFVAVARSVLFVMVDPDAEDVRLLGHVKNNLGPLAPTLKFSISGTKVAETADGDVWTSHLEWAGDDTRTIREALESAGQLGEDRSATSEAADWLRDYLTDAGGTADCAEAKTAGKTAGHSADAIKRARHKLHVTSRTYGFPRRAFWTLPVSCISAPTAPTAPTTTTTPNTPTGGQWAQSAQSVQSDGHGDTRPTGNGSGHSTPVFDPSLAFTLPKRGIQ